LKLEKVFDFPEVDELKKAISEYLKAENELSAEVTKAGSKLMVQIVELEKKVDEMKKQKMKVANALTECLSSGADASDLFLQLHQVSQEARDVEDLLKIMKRKSQYPATEGVTKLAKVAYEKGVELIKSHIKARNVLNEKNQLLNLVSYVIEASQRDTGNTLNQMLGLKSAIVKDFCHLNPEHSNLSWNELEKVAQDDIDKCLGGTR